MDEKDIKEMLAKLEAPDPSDADMHRAMDAAWDEMQGRKSLKWPVPHRIFAGVMSIFIMFGVFSYAVTQSTRSGSGDASGETNLINSAQLAQYPAGVRTSVVRMIIGGVKVESLRFNGPDQLALLDSPSIGVFHPQGGGSVYQSSPAELMADGQPGEWFYNMEINIQDIGMNEADITAFLPGITETVCRKLNEEVGVSFIPVIDSGLSAFYTKQMIDDGVRDYAPSSGHAPILAMAGQPFGCFQSGAHGPYVYYHVLVER